MKNTQIAIIGLGYVGLPLAVNFANAFAIPVQPAGGESQHTNHFLMSKNN